MNENEENEEDNFKTELVEDNEEGKVVENEEND
jgi:hypothetical protein